MLHLWVELLLLANHKKTKIFIGSELVKIDKGDVITSLSKLATLLNCSTKKITTALKTFEKDKMIINKKAKKWTHLTICNYETYQGSGNAEETVRKRRGNAEETVRKTIKNDKNDKNDKKEDNTDKADDFLIFKNIMDLWNNFIANSKYDIAKLVSIEKSRKTKLIAAAKKYKETPENLINRIIEKIKRSEFLQFKKYPKVNFDYCIGSDNIRRIFEGEFDNKKKGDNYGKSKLPTTIDPKTDYTIPPGGPGGAFTT